MSDIKVNIVSPFKERLHSGTITALNPYHIWVGKYAGIRLISQDGEVVKSFQTNFIIEDIATSQLGDLLATTQHGNQIKRINQNGDVSTIADLSPYHTQGIHVTNADDILVGLQKDNTGRVAILSSAGQMKRVIEYDNNRENLFVCPCKLTQNIDGNIWVMEGLDYRFVVVDRHGNYRFTYTGPTSALLDKRFNPYDIAHNSYGHIFVVDRANKVIRLVDKNGNFLQYLLTEQDGISSLKAIATLVDSEDKTWIASHDEILVARYINIK